MPLPLSKTWEFYSLMMNWPLLIITRELRRKENSKASNLSVNLLDVSIFNFWNSSIYQFFRFNNSLGLIYIYSKFQRQLEIHFLTKSSQILNWRKLWWNGCQQLGRRSRSADQEPSSFCARLPYSCNGGLLLYYVTTWLIHCYHEIFNFPCIVIVNWMYTHEINCRCLISVPTVVHITLDRIDMVNRTSRYNEYRIHSESIQTLSRPNSYIQIVSMRIRYVVFISPAISYPGRHGTQEVLSRGSFGFQSACWQCRFYIDISFVEVE